MSETVNAIIIALAGIGFAALVVGIGVATWGAIAICRHLSKHRKRLL